MRTRNVACLSPLAFSIPDEVSNRTSNSTKRTPNLLTDLPSPTTFRTLRYKVIIFNFTINYKCHRKQTPPPWQEQTFLCRTQTTCHSGRHGPKLAVQRNLRWQEGTGAYITVSGADTAACTCPVCHLQFLYRVATWGKLTNDKRNHPPPLWKMRVTSCQNFIANRMAAR